MDILDLRRRPPDEVAHQLARALERLGDQETLVVQSFSPLLPLLEPPWKGWPLVDGPSAFYCLIGRERPLAPLLDPVRARHQRLLELYPRMIQTTAEKGEIAIQLRDTFVGLVERQLQDDEEFLLPLVTEVTGEPRLARELGYEQRGIREGLQRLDGFLERVSAGLPKKEIDRFEIDFFHLIEHHLERQAEGLLPILELVAANDQRLQDFSRRLAQQTEESSPAAAVDR